MGVESRARMASARQNQVEQRERHRVRRFTLKLIISSWSRRAEEEDVVRVGPSCEKLDELHSLSRAYDMLPGPSLLLHTLIDDAFQFCPRQQELERTAVKTCINTRPTRPYYPISRGEPSDHQSLCVLQQSAKPSSPPT